MRHISILILFIFSLTVVCPAVARADLSGPMALLLLDSSETLVLNGVSLSETELDQLRTALTVPLDTPVLPGDYWYDPVSGLWGYVGGPSLGQIPPDLEIGGNLPADASGDSSDYWYYNSSGYFGYLNTYLNPNNPIPGLQLPVSVQQGIPWISGTGVFINGRELHVLELLVLMATDNYQYPAPNYQLRFWLDDNGDLGLGDVVGVDKFYSLVSDKGRQAGGYVENTNTGTVNWAGGSVLGGGDTVGFISSEYGGVSVTCGPDGGCIY